MEDRVMEGAGAIAKDRAAGHVPPAETEAEPGMHDIGYPSQPLYPDPLTQEEPVVQYDQATGALLVGDANLAEVLADAEPADPEDQPVKDTTTGSRWGALGPLVKVKVLDGTMWRGELVKGRENSKGQVMFCLHRAEMLCSPDKPIPGRAVPDLWQAAEWPVFIPESSVAWWTKTKKERD